MNKSPSPPGERSATLRFLLRLVFVIAIVVTVMLAIPLALVAAAFWAAEGSWDFEGRGFKYWVFVKGTRLERLGAVEPVGVIRYSISIGEGNFPGWTLPSTKARRSRSKLSRPMPNAARG
jgi:hypothetical protein